MKKYNNLLYALLSLCLVFYSCEKYLDVKENSTQVSISTANDCQLLLDNYGLMNISFPFDGEASADDYYMLDTKYNLLGGEDKDIYTWAANAQRSLASDQWQNPYKIIYNANLVLENLPKLKVPADQATMDNIKGQALFFRAFTFWSIAQLYAKPYSVTAGTDLGIPLRLSPDLNDVSNRGTVQQTYDRILQDLNEAVTLLSPSSPVSSRPNKTAAYAMLSRVYLSMNDYPNAFKNANSALGLNSQLIDYNTLSTSSTTPFSPRFKNKEDIFHSVMTNAFALLYPGITFVPSLSTAKIDLDLVNSYDNNDLRKSIFFKTIVEAGRPNSYLFSGNYEPITTAQFFNGLAVDELLLTRAECYARANNKDAAMTDLNMLLRSRWKTGTYVDMSATDANDALAKVLVERRKELLMRGLRWTDLRRLGLGATRKVMVGSTLTTIATLQPNDVRYTLLIPKEVITNAPQIQQNPR